MGHDARVFLSTAFLLTQKSLFTQKFWSYVYYIDIAELKDHVFIGVHSSFSFHAYFRFETLIYQMNGRNTWRMHCATTRWFSSSFTLLKQISSPSFRPSRHLTFETIAFQRKAYDICRTHCVTIG